LHGGTAAQTPPPDDIAAARESQSGAACEPGQRLTHGMCDASVSAVEEDFERLTRELQDAVLQQNAAHLDGVVAPGFHLITARAGNPATREEWIAAAVGPFRVASYEISDFRVVRAGDAAVVSYRLQQDARLGERIAPRNWLTTDVWTRVSGSWQITARHAEALPD
jgi:hypothetical protein